jgi:hypothetical protein
MSKHVSLVSMLSTSLLLTVGCEGYLDLEPDERPDAGTPAPQPDARVEYPLRPPPEVFPGEPVVTTPDDAPLSPPDTLDQEGVQLVFPPAASISTWTCPGWVNCSAYQVTMRGTARLPAGVAAVRVNGVDARLSVPNAEGVVAWQVEVAPARGRNELVVSSTDGSGNTTAEAARATVEYAPYMLLHPTGLELDERHDRLFVTDPGAHGLAAIDLETGAPTRIDLEESIDWTVLPQELSLDAAAGRGVGLFHDTFCDGSSGLESWTTISIDLETSSFDYENYFSSMPDCTELYDELEEYDAAVAMAPGGDAFFAAHEECWYEYVDEVRLRKCTIDVRERRLYDGDASGPGVVLCTNAECSVVNMIPDRSPAAGTSGVLVLVAENTPAGTAFEVHAVDPVMGSQASIATIRTDWDGTDLQPGAMTLDQAGDRLLMLARDRDHRVYVIGVDLASGAQTLLIARSATADGMELKGAADVVHDPRRDRVIVSVPYYGLFALDLETGLATALFRPTVGQGPLPLCGRGSRQEMGRPQRHCNVSTFDAHRQRFFVHEPGDEGSRIYVVDVTTGDRRLLVESGMVYFTPTLFADAPEDRLLILQGNGALYEIDGTTGAQTSLGVSPLFYANYNPSAWDPETNRLLYMPSDEDVYELRVYDVDTEEDRLLSSDSMGSGPSLRSDLYLPPRPRELIVTLDPSGERAFVSYLSRWHLIEVDLATGDRTAHAVGEQNSSSYAPPVLADTRRNRLLLRDLYNEDMWALDLESGESDTFVRYSPGFHFVFTDELIPDHARERALVIDEQGDTRMVDLQTGEHVVILRGRP